MRHRPSTDEMLRVGGGVIVVSFDDAAQHNDRVSCSLQFTIEEVKENLLITSN